MIEKKGLADRIEDYISGISERKVKVGCIVLGVAGLFLFAFLFNKMWFSSLNRNIDAKTLALIQVGLFLGFVIIIIGVKKAIGSIASRKIVKSLIIDKTTKKGPEVFKARMLKQKERYAEAIKEYRKLFSQFPERIDLLYEIAEIYRNDLKDKEKGLKTHMMVTKYPEEGEYTMSIRHSKEIVKELMGKGYKRPDIIEVKDEGDDEGC